MTPNKVMENLIAAAIEQAENPALWKESDMNVAALLSRELQRLHELIFQLDGWSYIKENTDCEIAAMEREMAAMRDALHSTGSAEAKLRYELGHLRSSFMAFAGHRAPCFGMPCSCGFEREQNRVRVGLMRNGVSA
jgi:hypothetical protein